jgi:hypothetical protein
VIENVASSNNLIACGFRLYNPSVEWAGDRTLCRIKRLDSLDTQSHDFYVPE